MMRAIRRFAVADQAPRKRGSAGGRRRHHNDGDATDRMQMPSRVASTRDHEREEKAGESALRAALETAGVNVGSVLTHTASSNSTQRPLHQGFKVVGGTGFEPVTPTMSR